MYLQKQSLCAAGLALVLAAPVSAAPSTSSPFSVGVGVSTLGAGINIGYALTNQVSLRGTYYQYDYDFSEVEDDIDYNFDLQLQNAALLVDYFPYGSGFRFTGGLAWNGNNLDATAKPSNSTFQIGDTTYTATDVGSLKGDIKFNDAAPYLGIGFTSGHSQSGLQFNADLGILFQGSASVNLNANGTLANDPGFQSDLAAEQTNLQNDLDDFDLYPVLSLGISYRY